MSSYHSPNNELKKLAGLLNDDSNATYISNNELLEKLDYHGITLLAAEHNTLPSELSPQIAKLKAMMVANEALKQAELAKLFNAFNQAGLNSVLFKGSALAFSLYPKPWLRPRSDSDVLIAPSDLSKFNIVFEQLGYQKLFAIQGKYVSYQSTYGKALVGDSFINIDLHWHINNRQMFAETFSSHELIENGQRLSRFGKASIKSAVNIPSTVDSLLIASLHRAGHHNKEERLAWLYDIHLLATSLSNEQWLRLCQQAKSKQISAITHNALETTRDYFGTNLEQTALQQLIDQTSFCEPSAIFLNRELSERHYFLADIKSMPNFTAKLSFIRESILPSPDYVRQQMNTRWASLAYIKRFFRGLKRVF